MGKYYAVADGRNTGVYNSWGDCSSQVTGYSGAKFKSFASKEAAQSFIASNSAPLSQPLSSSRPSAPSYSSYGGSSSFLSSTRSKPLEPKRDVQKIYTDGSSRGNQHANPKAGYGVYYGPGDSRNVAVPLGDVENTDVKRSNQRAELHGMGHALREIESSHNKGSDQKYEIYTDSQYARNALEEWTPKWRDNGWTSTAGKDVANRDIIEDASDRLDSLRSKGVNIDIRHVKGHGTNQGNIEADRLANIGAENDYK